MRYILIIASIFIFTSTLCAQEEEKQEDVSFDIIEKVPVYPGCTGDDNKVLKQCMSDNVAAFINKRFNIRKTSRGLASGTYTIFVAFKIDTDGQVMGIIARGPNRATEKEAKRVMKKLPTMIPGQQKGENVGVIYSLPIKFNVK